MNLREVLELFNSRLFFVVIDSDGSILTDKYIDVDDYFTYDKYRYLDDRKIDFIDVRESNFSEIPTVIITVSEDIYG